MSPLSRLLLLLSAASAMTAVPSGTGYAQHYGVNNRAVDLATVDAAALGDTLRSSVGLFAAGEWVVAGGVGALGGAFRAYLGSSPNRFGVPFAIGMGYARTIAAHDLARALHGAIGTELVAGFRHDVFAPRDAGALRLTVPVGLSLGNPSRTSVSLYAAPYVESGIMRIWEQDTPSCTPYCNYRLGDQKLRSAAGLGVGSRIALGRWALEILLRDMGWQDGHFDGGGEGALGVTYRLGR